MMIRLDRFPDKDAAIEYLRSEVLRSNMGCATKKDAEKYLMKHLPKESYYQTNIMRFLKNTYPNAVVWKEAAGAYSQQGIPDVTFIKDGRYFGFEIKRPYFGVLSKIQKQTIEKIREAGGIAEVVTFPEDVQKIIDKQEVN